MLSNSNFIIYTALSIAIIMILTNLNVSSNSKKTIQTQIVTTIPCVGVVLSRRRHVVVVIVVVLDVPDSEAPAAAVVVVVDDEHNYCSMFDRYCYDDDRVNDRE
jgi:hypothetical protein